MSLLTRLFGIGKNKARVESDQAKDKKPDPKHGATGTVLRQPEDIPVETRKKSGDGLSAQEMAEKQARNSNHSPINSLKISSESVIGSGHNNSELENKDISGPTYEWSTNKRVLGDYIVEGGLGRGGMGEVYLVRSESTGQKFAVKRGTLRDALGKRLFFAELQTWIDLPEYPHLVGFRFFRSLGNEIIIFAEYVKGGSLQDWIDEKDLYQGGHKEALRRILDITIQFSWGLEAAHKKGVVHQDVKPANVLISSDETAKVKGVQVTDYGLARARATAGIITSEVSKGGALVSHAGGYTPEFCSPEQSLMGKLSLKTDIWSWGVSVLEMFTGKVFWMAGEVAPEILNDYRENGIEDKSIPEMPDSLYELLRACFQHDPDDRPKSMEEISGKLEDIFKETTGQEYPRSRPLVDSVGTIGPVGQGEVFHDRRTTTGIQWTDPRKWLVAGRQIGIEVNWI